MKMFQHKLHRVMMQAIRLYADNLVSMDVCGWSITGAKQILGDTVSLCVCVCVCVRACVRVCVCYYVNIDCGILS